MANKNTRHTKARRRRRKLEQLEARRIAACVGKVKYPNEKLAKEAAKLINGLKTNHHQVTAYKCQYCNWHHVGGSNPRKQTIWLDASQISYEGGQRE